MAFLAVIILLTKDSEAYHKASSTLQLFTLSILPSIGNYNDNCNFDSFLLIFRCKSVTDQGLAKSVTRHQSSCISPYHESRLQGVTIMITIVSTHYFLFLGVKVSLIKDSGVSHKALSILQLSTLSILTSDCNYNNNDSFDSLLLILRCESITDQGLGSLSQGLKHLAALHTLSLEFSW